MFCHLFCLVNHLVTDVSCEPWGISTFSFGTTALNGWVLSVYSSAADNFHTVPWKDSINLFIHQKPSIHQQEQTKKAKRQTNKKQRKRGKVNAVNCWLGWITHLKACLKSLQVDIHTPQIKALLILLWKVAGSKAAKCIWLWVRHAKPPLWAIK